MLAWWQPLRPSTIDHLFSNDNFHHQAPFLVVTSNSFTTALKSQPLGLLMAAAAIFSCATIRFQQSKLFLKRNPINLSWSYSPATLPGGVRPRSDPPSTAFFTNTDDSWRLQSAAESALIGPVVLRGAGGWDPAEAIDSWDGRRSGALFRVLCVTCGCVRWVLRAAWNMCNTDRRVGRSMVVNTIGQHHMTAAVHMNKHTIHTRTTTTPTHIPVCE